MISRLSLLPPLKVSPTLPVTDFLMLLYGTLTYPRVLLELMPDGLRSLTLIPVLGRQGLCILSI